MVIFLSVFHPNTLTKSWIWSKRKILLFKKWLLAMLSLNCHTAKLTYSTRRCQTRSQNISLLLVYTDYSYVLQVFTLLTLGFHFFFYMYINSCGRACAWGAKKNGSLFITIWSRFWRGLRVWGKPAVPAAGNICPKKHMLLPLSETREACRSPSSFKNTFIKSPFRISDTQIHLDKELGNIWYFWTLFVIFQITPSYACYSLFCSSSSPGNQVLKNNHLINSSSHQECLHSFTNQQIMAEFTYQEKSLDQNITSKQIKSKICPSTSPP